MARNVMKCADSLMAAPHIRGEGEGEGQGQGQGEGEGKGEGGGSLL